MKNLMIAQSGGPTVAINATLVGIVERAITSGMIDRIYGARHGIKGLLDGKIVEIGNRLTHPDALYSLTHTPSSALGSCRFKIGTPAEKPLQYEQIFDCFRRYDIGYFIYIGGNDSMDTVAKLSNYAREHAPDISVMGAPKTIDNDLCGMDHSPGFLSAAKYVATTFAELSCDCSAYDVPSVTIVEVMGRNAGWLTATSVLAREKAGDAPHLIYLPEVPFSAQKFVADVKDKLASHRSVLVAISEGIRNPDGSYVSAGFGVVERDAFGHQALTGANRVLEHIVRTEIGCKCRAIELSLMQRCAAHLASETDLAESRILGAVALDRAIHGESGLVAVLSRVSDDPYEIAYGTVPASEIANRERKVPRAWINEAGNDVNESMLHYLRPLLGEREVARPCHFFF